MSEAQFSLWGGETGADLHEEIKTNGFALIRHNIPSEAIDEFVAAYADFTDNHPDPEPKTMDAMIRDTDELDELDYSVDTQDEWHKYRTNTPHFAKPNGYTNRSLQARVLREERGLDVEEDPKEYFHYSPGMQQELRARHEEYGWGELPPEVVSLLRKAQTLHYLAKTTMQSFYRSLELTHPDLAKYTRKEDLDISPIRGLFYHKDQGEVLAEDHYDRGLGTLQIAESHLGLRVRNPQTDEMDVVERDPELGIAFPALKWKQAFPDSELNPLLHDVVRMDAACQDRSLYGNNVARWSIIFFTNSQLLGEQANKRATHGELNKLVA